MIASAITGNNVDAVGRETGLRINKNQQLLFNGVTGRDFILVGILFQEVEKRLQQTKIIIRLLKQSMSAQRGGYKTVKGLFLKSPDIFYLTYMKGKEQHPFLNAFKPCALTSMSVNYTGSGTYATYHDGNPVHLNLSLSFRELTAVYREDYFRRVRRWSRILMGFFRELPNIEYLSPLADRNSSLDYIKVKNLFRRVKIRDDLKKYFTIFDKITIRDGFRPDQVAEQVYGQSDLDWVVLTTAGIINVNNEWALNSQELYEFALNKYGAYLNATKHYETIEIRDIRNRLILPAGKL